MLRFLSTVLAVFVGVFLFVILFFMVLGAAVGGASRTEPMPKSIVLKLDVRQPIADATASSNMLAGFQGEFLTVVGIVEALEQAGKDPAVRGLVLRADAQLGLDPAQAEEIRDAVSDFKSSGKFVISHVQDLSDPSLGGYFLISVADQVWMQPAGTIFTQGLAASRVYFKHTLEKLDSSAEVLAYHEYKTAFNSFINDAPTDTEREQDLRQLNSIYDSFTSAIAKSRKMTKDEFAALLRGGPYSGPEAVKAGWIDKLGFADDAETAAEERAGKESDTVELADYARRKGSPYKSGPVIALVQAQGEIIDGEAQGSFFGTSDQFGSGTLTEAILEAAEDDDVEAIVFRINSPGGAATAPDEVADAVAKARAKGKPVIVNMSGVAASAGYWIAAGADKIVAQPSTITGSIGVVGAKFVLKGVYDKLGITVSEMAVGGDKSFMYSEQRPFTPEELAALNKEYTITYDTFLDRVAKGRKLPRAEVEQLAKGRVWTGIDAKDRKLVDQLGGLKVAIAEAKTLANIPQSSSIELRHFPTEKSFFEQVFQAFGASAEVAHTVGVMAKVLKLGPTSELLKALQEQDAAMRAPFQARARPITLH